MYTTLALAALAVVLVLIIQAIRRKQPQDRMYYAALGGSISAAIILVPSFLLPTLDSRRNWWYRSFPLVY